MSSNAIDKYSDYFCILDICNQKMKLYNNREKEVTKIHLKDVKIEESRDKEFILTKGNDHYNF
jgi:hypothetical protein